MCGSAFFWSRICTQSDMVGALLQAASKRGVRPGPPRRPSARASSATSCWTRSASRTCRSAFLAAKCKGVARCLMVATFTRAPYSSSLLHARAWPSLAAMWSGVALSLATVFGEQDAFRTCSSTFTAPLYAAKCVTAQASPARLAKSAPISIRNCAQCVWPRAAATCSGDIPSSVAASIAPPAELSSCSARRCPPCAAMCAAVCKRLLVALGSANCSSSSCSMS
mmetsp:Transcript_70706/g.188548  ORF Transcript_70706/g.188548 Transcript_70706/m.188548 type:complete len:224 (+) Transcript_70706:296-967(+)